MENATASRPDPAGACALPAAGLRDRLRWVQCEILPHVVEKSRLENGLALELAPAPGLERRLEHWIGLERECCGSLEFVRVPAETPNRLRLEIRGIDPHAAWAWLASDAVASDPATPSRRARIAKATGFGVAGSLLVCCVLPVGVGALLGGVAAAPLAALDPPVPIVVGALLGASAAWRWLGRSRPDRAPRSRRGGRDCSRGC